MANLLVDIDEYKDAHIEFCAVHRAAYKLSSEVLELIDDNVRICSFSRADYSLRCWDSTWQDVITEHTAIRDALQKKDTAGTLLCEYLLAYLEKLDSIHEILTGLDWASLKQLTLKRSRLTLPDKR